MVEGPDIVLAADAAQPVALVLHELATNSAKYGALSIPKGHVSVQWHQRANGRVPEALVLDWKETGGPLVLASISPGYGTSVVKDLIPYELGGVVDLVFAPEGVRWASLPKIYKAGCLGKTYRASINAGRKPIATRALMS
jgi:two-component sensor histidine kinase